jgi:hypothetical protein
MRCIAFAAVMAGVLFHCGGSYRPLDVADACACKPSEYCEVSAPKQVTCHALPQTCGTRPSCDCVGDRGDACRDEDGRITVLPSRSVGTCDACSSQEYCAETANGSVCRVLPPECDATPTCACFLGSRGRSARFTCAERSGRVVASIKR